MNTNTTIISEEVIALLRARDPILKAICYEKKALTEVQTNLSKDDLPDSEREFFEEAELKRKKFLEGYMQLCSVHDIIKSMPDNILKSGKYCSFFEKRVQSESEKRSLSLREEAVMLGISPQAIYKSYSNRIKCDGKGPGINRNHLEVFSLLLNVSPCYLVGLTDDSGEYFISKFDDNGIISGEKLYRVVVPMDFFEPTAINLSSYIIMNLFKSDEKMDMNDQELLSLFISICDAKHNHRLKMKEALLAIPNIKRVKDVLLEAHQYDAEQWFDYLCRMSKVRKSIFVFQEALLRLSEKDPDLLNLLAHILASPSKIKRLACAIINDGGFRDTPQSFYGFTVCSTNENGVPNVSVSEKISQKCAVNASSDSPEEHPAEH